MIIALSRFGTFNQLGVMQSSSTTAFANLSTFTFWNVSYASHWVVLQAVERYSALNPTGARYLRLERPDARQSAAIATYGTSATTFSPWATNSPRLPPVPPAASLTWLTCVSWPPRSATRRPTFPPS